MMAEENTPRPDREAPASVTIVAIDAMRLQVLLTGRPQCSTHAAGAFALPCAPLVPGESEEQAVRGYLNTELGQGAGIRQIERMGMFFHEELPGHTQVAFLALVSAETVEHGAVWWNIDALPELACGHAPAIYAIKTLWLKLARTQNVLTLLPETLTLQEIRLLVVALGQIVQRTNNDRSTP